MSVVAAADLRWILTVGAEGASTVAGWSSFGLEFLDSSGRRRRESMGSCQSVPFEHVTPVRSFRWSKGLEHFPGWWWSSTMERHVGYESWLERDHLMLLDFDPDVVGVSSQPFWLHWAGEGGDRRHAPDFFVRHSDGTGVVLDVRPDDRVGPTDVEVFTATARACAGVGWTFRRVGVLDALLVANVRWLSRYRHPRCGLPRDVADQLLKVFTFPRPLFDGVTAIGDRLMVLPVLFHLMWCQRLSADLAAAPLGAMTLVCGAAAGRR